MQPSTGKPSKNDHRSGKKEKKQKRGNSPATRGNSPSSSPPPAPRRGRDQSHPPPAGGASTGSGSISEDIGQRILKELGDIKHNMAHQGGELAQLSTNFNNYTVSAGEQFASLDKKVEDKFEALDVRLATLEEKDKAADPAPGGHSAPQWGPFQSAGSGPSSSDAPSSLFVGASVPPPTAPTVVATDHWDRPADPTIIKVNTDKKAKVSIAAIRAAILAYTTERLIPVETYVVQGHDLGAFFTIQFGGMGSLAAKQVKDFFRGIKKSDGTYYAFSAVDPSSQTIPIHFNPDKNGRSQRLEGATKRLAKQIRTNYPNIAGEVHDRRHDGFISHGSKQLAQVAVSREAVSVSWDPKRVAICGIDKNKERDDFLGSENIQWEV
jgi:hypothetical protein